MHYAITEVRWNEGRTQIIEAKVHEVVVMENDGQKELELLPPYNTSKEVIVRYCHSDEVQVAIMDGAGNWILTDHVRTMGQQESLVSINTDGYRTDSLALLPAY